METKKTKKEDVIRIINNAPVDIHHCPFLWGSLYL